MTVKLTDEVKAKQTDAFLAELLRLIRGETLLFGPGISVHKLREDDLMQCCLELEKRGLIVRHHEDDDRIDWKPVNN